MSDDTKFDTTTPEQDKILDDLREGLRQWLLRAGERDVEHDLCLTALMLFTASGVASSNIDKDAFLQVMGHYYDAYRKGIEERASRPLREWE